MKGGQTTTSLVEFIDLYPTLVDLCGLEMPHATAGVSLRPILADPSASLKDAAFTLVTRGDKRYGQRVRTSRWRFTRWSDGQAELYDHAADPEEFHDVSAQHADIVAELTPRIRELPVITSKP
jgi:iduronate 2-sulfatase